MVLYLLNSQRKNWFLPINYDKNITWIPWLVAWDERRNAYGRKVNWLKADSKSSFLKVRTWWVSICQIIWTISFPASVAFFHPSFFLSWSIFCQSNWPTKWSEKNFLSPNDGKIFNQRSRKGRPTHSKTFTTH